MTTFSRNILLLLLSILVGVSFGVSAMWLAWEHNPQCSVHCAELGVSWGYWLSIGASWAAITSAITFFAFWAATKIWHRLSIGGNRLI